MIVFFHKYIANNGGHHMWPAPQCPPSLLPWQQPPPPLPPLCVYYYGFMSSRHDFQSRESCLATKTYIVQVLGRLMIWVIF